MIPLSPSLPLSLAFLPSRRPTAGDVFTKTRTFLFVPPFICLFLVSCLLLLSQYLFLLFFKVAIILDIMEGQWRGGSPKMAKMS